MKHDPFELRSWLDRRVRAYRDWVSRLRRREVFQPSMRRDWRYYCKDRDWRYLGPEDFVLRHGRYWVSQPLPREFRRGRLGRCGVNATRLALRRPDLTYVEGYATPLDPQGVAVIYPLGHSWVVDREGLVIDPTWPEGAREYFGVPFKHSYVAEVCSKGPRSTLIERWRDGFPLLRYGSPAREWKATRFNNRGLSSARSASE